MFGNTLVGNNDIQSLSRTRCSLMDDGIFKIWLTNFGFILYVMLNHGRIKTMRGPKPAIHFFGGLSSKTKYIYIIKTRLLCVCLFVRFGIHTIRD